MTDSNNILTATLAELKTYFEGWHTSNYDALHKKLSPTMRTEVEEMIRNLSFDDKYAPLSHVTEISKTNEASQIYKLGHCYVIDNLKESTFREGYALSAHQGYELNKDIEELKKTVDSFNDIPNIKIGRMRGVTDDRWRDIYSNNIDAFNTLTADNNNKPEKIDWGVGKLVTDYGLHNGVKDYIVVQVLEPNGTPIKNANIFICIHNMYYSRTTQASGAGRLKINLAEGGGIGDASLWGDQWFLVDIFVHKSENDSGKMYNAISKQILVNYANDLWNTHITNGNIQYDSNNYPYRTDNPSKRLSGSKRIFKDGKYYRWERDEYPYGKPINFPLNVSIYDDGKNE